MNEKMPKDETIELNEKETEKVTGGVQVFFPPKKEKN
jgi:hypothetical protein